MDWYWALYFNFAEQDENFLIALSPRMLPTAVDIEGAVEGWNWIGQSCPLQVTDCQWYIQEWSQAKYINCEPARRFLFIKLGEISVDSIPRRILTALSILNSLHLHWSHILATLSIRHGTRFISQYGRLTFTFIKSLRIPRPICQLKFPLSARL